MVRPCVQIKLARARRTPFVDTEVYVSNEVYVGWGAACGACVAWSVAGVAAALRTPVRPSVFARSSECIEIFFHGESVGLEHTRTCVQYKFSFAGRQCETQKIVV